MAGILHDVLDDTRESLQSIEREFGDDVAKLVAGVSRLSYINQVSFLSCLLEFIHWLYILHHYQILL